jgi:peptidoglycan L-alanyl-D-glutamate endopeptidase CwlK
MDLITLERIKTAHPKLRAELDTLYRKANNQLGKNVRLRFAYVYRSAAEQDALYYKRPKVTNAKGWQSIHNYGLAFDIVLLIDKDNNGTFETAEWNTIKDFDGDGIADWTEVVKIFKDAGWEWGGDWKSFKDAPHFQKTYGFDWRVLKQRIDKGIIIQDENGITYPKI